MRARFGTAGLALAIGLLACGCGGGDAADVAVLGAAGTPGTAGPAATPSGLVANPDAIGPVLYADATPLRVMRHGATWNYRGVEQRGDPAAPAISVYNNIVTITETKGSFVETASNRYIDSLDAVGDLKFEGGQYTHNENILIDNVHVVSGTFVELRSPVRQNEQFVAIDRKSIPVNSDLDGDGVIDKADVAAWTRVIGKETIDLPNRRAVETVRVDLTIRVQIVLSRGNVVTPLQEAVKSHWYAPGLGIVRKRVDRPDQNLALPRRVVTEVLETFDGVSAGLGYTPLSRATVPPKLPPAFLQEPVAAVGFGSHAVVAAHVPDQLPTAGIALAQLDGRGKVLAVRKYGLAELFPGADKLTEPHLLRVGDELRLIARADRLGVAMVAFDPTGQRILRAPTVMQADASMIRDLEGNTYRIAQGGERLWLNWIRNSLASNGTYHQEMMLQAFDSAGRPLGTERALRSEVRRNIFQVRMVFADNRLALSWHEGNWSPEYRLALVDGASGALTERALDLDDSACPAVGLVGLQPGLALTCRADTAAPLRAARLDAGGNMVFAGAALSDETVRAPWLLDLEYGGRVLGDGGELIVLANQFGRLWPEDGSNTSFITVLRTRSLEGRPAGREPELLARIPVPGTMVRNVVPMGNRLLLIGSDAVGDLSTAVVWLAY